jgi:hypothetical protein
MDATKRKSIALERLKLPNMLAREFTLTAALLILATLRDSRNCLTNENMQ